MEQQRLTAAPNEASLRSLAPGQRIPGGDGGFSLAGEVAGCRSWSIAGAAGAGAACTGP